MYLMPFLFALAIGGMKLAGAARCICRPVHQHILHTPALTCKAKWAITIPGFSITVAMPTCMKGTSRIRRGLQRTWIQKPVRANFPDFLTLCIEDHKFLYFHRKLLKLVLERQLTRR